MVSKVVVGDWICCMGVLLVGIDYILLSDGFVDC